MGFYPMPLLKAARLKALEALGLRAKEGVDPADAERARSRRTVAELCAAFLADEKKKNRSWKEMPTTSTA